MSKGNHLYILHLNMVQMTYGWVWMDIDVDIDVQLE